MLGLCCTATVAESRRRSAAACASDWQWDVNDSFHVTVDGFFTRLDAPTVGYHRVLLHRGLESLDEGTGLHRWSNVSITDHWVDGMTIAERAGDLDVTEYCVVDTTQVDERHVDAYDRLHFSFDAYLVGSRAQVGRQGRLVVSGIGGSRVGRVDMNNNALPDISVTLDDGRDFATALANRELGDDD